MTHVVELAASALELIAVAIITIAFAYATVWYLLRARTGIEGAYENLKATLGRALLLGLEFLVAADVIRTVAIEPTLRNVALLGLLVVVRTFLSWSVVVEIEGTWPWRMRSSASAVEQPKL